MRCSSVRARYHILSGAAILAFTQFGASLAGLLRDRTLAWTFPNLEVVDVYVAAFRPSDFLFQMLIMSAVGTILVPMLTKRSFQNDTDHVGQLLSAAMGTGVLFFGLIALFLILFLPQLAPFFTAFEGDSLRLYIAFGRIVLISDLLMVVGNIAGQYLITIERYWIYGVTPMVYSIATVVGTVLLTPVIGPYGPIVGTAIGALVYAILRCWAVINSGMSLTLRFWHEDMSHVGWLMLPRMVALGALQLELLLFDRFASGFESGAVTINAYARNFESVVVGVIGIALAQAVFSRVSHAAVAGDMDRFWKDIRSALLLVMLLTIPSSIFLVLLTPFAAWLVALRHVLPLFSSVLAIYAVSILFESMNHVLLRGFYALHRTDIPAVWNVINVVSAVGCAWFFLPSLGLPALAMGFGVGQGIQMIGLGFSLYAQCRITNVVCPFSGTS